MSHELTAYLSIFNQFKLNELLPYYFVNCESFLDWDCPDTLAQCEGNMDDSIDSGDFYVRGYLPLIWKDSGTHMHGRAVYVKEGLSFAQDPYLENSADSYLCFRQTLHHSASYFFFLYWSSSSALCMAFDSISSNIDEVLSINPSANDFVFGGFNVHHKDWLNYSGGSQATLLRLLTFPLRSETVIFKALHF